MAVVAVPEAAVYQDQGAVLREGNVRLPGKFVVVDSEPEALSMKGGTNQHFGFGVFALDAAHHSGTGRLVNYIGHDAD
mgnify:CR=1 FL=1